MKKLLLLLAFAGVYFNLTAGNSGNCSDVSDSVSCGNCIQQNQTSPDNCIACSNSGYAQACISCTAQNASNAQSCINCLNSQDPQSCINNVVNCNNSQNPQACIACINKYPSNAAYCAPCYNLPTSQEQNACFNCIGQNPEAAPYCAPCYNLPTTQEQNACFNCLNTYSGEQQAQCPACSQSKNPQACITCIGQNPQTAPYCAPCYNLPTSQEQNACFNCLNTYSGEQQAQCPKLNTKTLALFSDDNIKQYGNAFNNNVGLQSIIDCSKLPTSQEQNACLNCLNTYSGEQQAQCPNIQAVNLLNQFSSNDYGFSNLNPSNASSCIKSANPHNCMNCLRYYQGSSQCATLDSNILSLFTDDNVNKYGNAFNNNVGLQSIIDCSKLPTSQEQNACLNCLNTYSGEQQAQCPNFVKNCKNSGDCIKFITIYPELASTYPTALNDCVNASQPNACKNIFKINQFQNNMNEIYPSYENSCNNLLNNYEISYNCNNLPNYCNYAYCNFVGVPPAGGMSVNKKAINSAMFNSIAKCSQSKNPQACIACIEQNPQAAPYCAPCYSLPTSQEQSACFNCLNSYSGEQQAQCPKLDNNTLNLLNQFNSNDYGFSNLNPSNASSCIKSANPHNCMNCLRYYQGSSQCATLDSNILALFTDDNVNKYSNSFNNNVGLQPFIDCAKSKDPQNCFACVINTPQDGPYCAPCYSLPTADQKSCLAAINKFYSDLQSSCNSFLQNYISISNYYSSFKNTPFNTMPNYCNAKMDTSSKTRIDNIYINQSIASKFAKAIIKCFSTQNSSYCINCLLQNVSVKNFDPNTCLNTVNQGSVCDKSKNPDLCYQCVQNNPNSIEICGNCINGSSSPTNCSSCIQSTQDNNKQYCSTLTSWYQDPKNLNYAIQNLNQNNNLNNAISETNYSICLSFTNKQDQQTCNNLQQNINDPEEFNMMISAMQAFGGAEVAKCFSTQDPKGCLYNAEQAAAALQQCRSQNPNAQFCCVPDQNQQAACFNCVKKNGIWGALCCALPAGQSRTACLNCTQANPNANLSCPACATSAKPEVCLNGCLNQVSGYEKQSQCATLVNKYTNASGQLDQNGFDNAVQELQNS